MITTKITLIPSGSRRIAGGLSSALSGLASVLRRPSSVVSLLVVCLLAVSALAGDLAVDNLTVSSNAAVYGKLDFCSTVNVTNGGGTATGGAITTNGGYIIHTFTNVGTVNFTLTSCPLQGSVFVVAGGGAGGAGSGAGGAGGLIYIPNYTMPTGTYTVTGNSLAG
jgi:hypothetical protein